MSNLHASLTLANAAAQEVNIENNYNSELKDKLSLLKASLDSFDLYGNQLLVAPYKLEAKTTKSGLILHTAINEEIDVDTMRKKLQEVKDPYQYKGIVVKIADSCSESFRDRIKVGDVIGFLKQSIPHMKFEIDPNNLVIGEDPMIVKINENHVERKFK